MKEKITAKDFFNKLLAGISIAIIVGLIPNAILGELFKFLSTKASVFKYLLLIVQIAQFAVPCLVGALVSMQFKLNPIETASVTMSTLVASGVVSFNEDGFKIAGIGDLINTIIISGFAVYLCLLLRGKLGNLTLVLLPMIIVCIAGGIGVLILPYVKMITGAIGALIANFTNFKPLIMSILLSISFAIVIISPMSTVAIALAVGLSGLSSGAANIGICATCASLVVGSLRANPSGITIAVLLGSPKMFLSNWIKHPILNLPIILTALISGIFAYIFNIQGTPESAGFGFSGLVGPINAFARMEGSAFNNLIITIIAFFIVPFVSAFVVDYLFVKVLKLYKHEVFKFESED